MTRILTSNNSIRKISQFFSPCIEEKDFVSTSNLRVQFLEQNAGSRFVVTSTEEKKGLYELSSSAISKFLKEEEKYGSIF